MEIVDEILTPGCPNCALKHLSAALAWLPVADARGTFCSDEEVLRARAYINFVEAIEGYESHWYYGVGLLVRAEELSAMDHSIEPALGLMRERRCEAMLASTPDERREALKKLVPTPASLIQAHVEEACRELPELRGQMTALAAGDAPCASSVSRYVTLAKIIIKLIKWVRDEFFATEQTKDFETKENEEKGGEAMATKKATAKKAPAKAAVKKAPAKAAGKKSCKK
jgi:hypothetical protein